MKTTITSLNGANILGNADGPIARRVDLRSLLRRWRRDLGYCSIFAATAVLVSQPQNAMAEEQTVTDRNRSLKSVPFENQTRCAKPRILQRQNGFFLPSQKRNDDLINELAGGDDCPGTPIPSGTYSQGTPFRDSGTTVGANDSVSEPRYIDYCYYSYNANGPDQIYSFTLTGLGTNPKIEVSTTSASYQPMIYVLETRNGVGCNPGTGFNDNCRLRIVSYAPAPGGTALLERSQIDRLPFNVQLFLFIDSSTAGPNDSGPYTVRLQDVGIAPAPPPPPSAIAKPKFDFDGDERSDISVFRPSDGFWWIKRSNQGVSGTQFGVSTDQIVPADYDGDGKTDMAVYRDGRWLWLNSSNGTVRQAGWGVAGDTPQPADYTGDGRSELAVFRGGTWFVYNIATGAALAEQFGLATDRPVAADYDGDGRTDYAVYRDGIWYLRRTTQGFAALQFGLPSDNLIPSDYDGDGKSDLAVFRNGTWYLQQSLLGFTAFQFGSPGDVPVPADYDGNGRADAAVFRTGVWYLKQSTAGFAVTQFGLRNDKPVPAAFLP